MVWNEEGWKVDHLVAEAERVERERAVEGVNVNLTETTVGHSHQADECTFGMTGGGQMNEFVKAYIRNLSDAERAELLLSIADKLEGEDSDMMAYEFRQLILEFGQPG